MVMMNMKRCGVRDNMGMTVKEGKRGKRYSVDGRKWYKEKITWRVNSFTTDLERAKVIDIMTRALAVNICLFVCLFVCLFFLFFSRKRHT